MLKSSICCSDARTSAMNSDASDWHAFANAYAVLAKFCALKSPMQNPAALANTLNSDSSGWPPPQEPPQRLVHVQLSTCQLGILRPVWQQRTASEGGPWRS